MPRVDLTPRSLPTTFEKLVQAYPPAAIHDEVAYNNAMEIMSRLTSIPHPTEGQRKYLDTLAVLVEAYEDEVEGAHPEGVDAIDVLQLMMDDRGMTASDLGRLLGDRSLGPKLLNGQRSLSKAHIKKLSDFFKVSPAVFF